jgi:pyruvate dehydrogenase (quinone)
VIALCGDGGFNMLMCESPAAVHHELPVKVVVYNNFAFGLITLEPESAGLAPFRRRIELPNPDLRRLRGLAAAVAFGVTKPGELHAELNDALEADGPAIVDAVVAADEMPNLPHVSQVGHYAVAKIKEAVLAVTGS